ncbi:DUF3168 domain-containing protein [Staphylococcus delphini]|uniref:DUF3168 domain-containing protein n=1 Tax=Staphylococcus delphini TaxID=53344 RepID=UPI0021D14678|nr:DUF3168 domain-containing protein [Staphylococcus delphini]UXS43741.1 DUF3168 domain-containing protein [Staphylococcus delphini]UXV46342.1 DUF3168 domain-containing protein [Staphylococcus delphini]
MWVSAESLLFNQIMNNLIENPITDKLVGGRVFDCVQKDVDYPYIVVGESNVTESERSPGMRETIGITFHVYSQYENGAEARELLKYLNYACRQHLEFSDYEIDWIKKDNSQVFTDIDQFTKHGVLRMLYKVRHKTKIERV